MNRGVNALAAMPRAELRVASEQTFGRLLPTGCGQTLIRQLLAWRWQADQYGDLTRAEQQQLSGTGSAPLSTGSRLVRVWQGWTHQVEVLRDGFRYQGERYRSLSAIAFAITGTRWSGPVFFGIKKTRK